MTSLIPLFIFQMAVLCVTLWKGCLALGAMEGLVVKGGLCMTLKWWLPRGN